MNPLILFTAPLSQQSLTKYSLCTHDHVFVVKHFHKQKSSVLKSALFTKIISLYYNHKPTFTFNAQGRPYLQTSLPNNPIFFSLSHSADILVVIVSLDEAVGIDVEKIQPRKKASQIAERYFLGNLKNPFNLEDFYQEWTKAEALTKAKGSNLYQELAQIKHIGSQAFINHQVSHFSPKEGFISAICRPKNSLKELTLFTIHNWLG